MLSGGHQTRHHGKTGSHDAKKFGVARRIDFKAVRPGAHAVGGQTHPRCDSRWQGNDSRHCKRSAEKVKSQVDASGQLRHGTKVGGRAAQYLRGMKEITPYRPEIRFSDVDAYGIVHNATYIVYLEQARIHWWRQAMGEGTWDWSKVGVLVAHHSIDYLRPVRLGDELEIQSHIGELGNKSMDVHYELTCGGHPVARAKTVLVCFDHQTKATIPVPEAWREALEVLNGE